MWLDGDDAMWMSPKVEPVARLAQTAPCDGRNTTILGEDIDRHAEWGSLEK